MSIEIISENKEQILKEVLYVEELFFGGLKTYSKPSYSQQPSSQKASAPSPSPDLESESSDVQEDVKEGKEVGEQIMLPEVGSLVEATFVNIGSVWLKKAKRKSTCINLLLKGKPAYIVGSYFAEDEVVPTLVYGDSIRIEKVSQFKRAANREHAKSAKFKITKL